MKPSLLPRLAWSRSVVTGKELSVHGPAISSCVAALAMLLILPAGADDWPQWRGPQRNGISAESGGLSPATGAEPVVLWQASVGTGFSSCAVAQGRVYTLGNQDETDVVRCLNSETGQELWQYRYPCALYPKAFEGGPLATPTVAGDRVYSLSKFGDCLCLDAQTGRLVWSRKFEPPVATKADYAVWWGFAGSILATRERLLLAVGTAGVALDPLTGEVLWDNGPGYPGYSSPVAFRIGPQSCFGLVSGHEIVVAQADNGRVLWRIPWKTTWDQNAPDLIVEDGKLFVSTGHNTGCALFDLTATPPIAVWRNKNMRNYLGSCVLWEGNLYGFDDKQLRCIDWQTGAVRWTLPDTGLGTLLLAGRRLLALQEDGTLLTLEATPEACRPLGRTKILTGRCWSAPALANGRLYVRNAAGVLVCLDLRRR